MADFTTWTRENLERVASEMLERLVSERRNESELLRFFLIRSKLKGDQASNCAITDSKIEASTLEVEPDIGSGDVSKCLPAWIKTFCEKFEAGQGYSMSHSAVTALAHTLIAARVRCERLVRERDEAKADQNRLKTSTIELTQ